MPPFTWSDEVVGDDRARVAEQVAVAGVERDTVGGIGALLHLELQGELPPDPVADGLPQCLPEQPCPAAAVGVAADAAGRGDVVDGRRRPSPSPSCRSRSGRAHGRRGPGRSGIPPGRRSIRALGRADRLLGHQAPGEQDRVVHQIPAHLSAGVAQTGGEQQPGVLDRVGGQHHDVRMHRPPREGGGTGGSSYALVLDAGDPAGAVRWSRPATARVTQGDGRAPAFLGTPRGVFRPGGTERNAAGRCLRRRARVRRCASCCCAPEASRRRAVRSGADARGPGRGVRRVFGEHPVQVARGGGRCGKS